MLTKCSGQCVDALKTDAEFGDRRNDFYSFGQSQPPNQSWYRKGNWLAKISMSRSASDLSLVLILETELILLIFRTVVRRKQKKAKVA